VGAEGGTLTSFDRYSPEIKSSGVTWGAKTLNDWLKSPAAFIAGNSMPFEGIGDPNARADLIAYLKDASAGQASASSATAGAWPA